MAQITMGAVIGQLLGVLKESFEGPQRWGYFTDEGPEGALFGTLGKLSAEQASRSLGGTSIAAHVHHTTFGLEASSAWISGDCASRNWPESWRVSTVDETTWKKLLEEMRKRYEGNFPKLSNRTPHPAWRPLAGLSAPLRTWRIISERFGKRWPTAERLDKKIMHKFARRNHQIGKAKS